MFVVARREGEELVIADAIRVTVLSVTGKIVRLGFKAPPSVRVERVDPTTVQAIPNRRSGDSR